ncbi:UbiA prenyltransferase family domain containing protein [Rhypophila sp. PSN 637]
MPGPSQGAKTYSHSAIMVSQPEPNPEDDDDPSVNYFPHLPPYSDPKTGLLSHFPISLIPYGQLMRLDKPAGLYAFYFPYLIGMSYSAALYPSDIPPSSLLHLAFILLPFNVLLRGAACTWNDTLDRRFDRKVARCRHRPVARGAVSPLHAHLFTVFQLVLLFALQHAFLPKEVVSHTVFMVFLFGVYAYLKRVTYYPQVELGVAFAWAVFFIDALFPFTKDKASQFGTGALFSSIILWTIVYDTIYAHQDIADDEKAGVKGMALLFKESSWLDTKNFSAILTLAIGGLLTYLGVVSDFGMVYLLGTVGGVLSTMAYYIASVDLKVPESCGMWFHRQFWIVGAGYVSGFVGEYMVRRGGF